MIELVSYVCTNCGNVRALVGTLADGAICPICSAVNSQERLTIVVLRDKETLGLESEATFQIQRG